MDISVLTQCFGENGMPDECSLKSNLIEIKEKLESKEVTWEMFILALGELLKSTNITSRKKGVIILCKFINLQSLSSVTDEELSFLIEFLLRRLKDHHSFVPVIVESLLFLLRTFKIDDKQALTIFDTINKESFTQQLNIDERFQVYTLIAHLFNDHKEAFRSINNDFLYGFIQIIEGERDPRCLVLSFKLFQQVITHLELGHLDEEAFEVISCYFPILYNPVCKLIKSTLKAFYGIVILPLSSNRLSKQVRKLAEMIFIKSSKSASNLHQLLVHMQCTYLWKNLNLK